MCFVLTHAWVEQNTLNSLNNKDTWVHSGCWGISTGWENLYYRATALGRSRGRWENGQERPRTEELPKPSREALELLLSLLCSLCLTLLCLTRSLILRDVAKQFWHLTQGRVFTYPLYLQVQVRPQRIRPSFYLYTPNYMHYQSKLLYLLIFPV